MVRRARERLGVGIDYEGAPAVRMTGGVVVAIDASAFCRDVFSRRFSVANPSWECSVDELYPRRYPG